MRIKNLQIAVIIMTKAARNKTIDISVENGQEYLARCISINSPATLNNILDKTILGDTFETIKHLPPKSIDLLLVDPPYNLDKNFHGNEFKRITDEAYEEYIDRCFVETMIWRVYTLKSNPS